MRIRAPGRGNHHKDMPQKMGFGGSLITVLRTLVVGARPRVTDVCGVYCAVCSIICTITLTRRFLLGSGLFLVHAHVLALSHLEAHKALLQLYERA